MNTIDMDLEVFYYFLALAAKKLGREEEARLYGTAMVEAMAASDVSRQQMKKLAQELGLEKQKQ